MIACSINNSVALAARASSAASISFPAVLMAPSTIQSAAASTTASFTTSRAAASSSSSAHAAASASSASRSAAASRASSGGPRPARRGARPRRPPRRTWAPASLGQPPEASAAKRLYVLVSYVTLASAARLGGRICSVSGRTSARGRRRLHSLHHDCNRSLTPTRAVSRCPIKLAGRLGSKGRASASVN